MIGVGRGAERIVEVGRGLQPLLVGQIKKQTSLKYGENGVRFYCIASALVMRPSRVQGAGCRVQGAECRVQGAGCKVQGLQPPPSTLFVRKDWASPILAIGQNCRQASQRAGGHLPSSTCLDLLALPQSA